MNKKRCIICALALLVLFSVVLVNSTQTQAAVSSKVKNAYKKKAETVHRSVNSDSYTYYGVSYGMFRLKGVDAPLLFVHVRATSTDGWTNIYYYTGGKVRCLRKNLSYTGHLEYKKYKKYLMISYKYENYWGVTIYKFKKGKLKTVYQDEGNDAESAYHEPCTEQEQAACKECGLKWSKFKTINCNWKSVE